ncbi:FecR domain-containing protein [Bacteroides sp. OttesenSCG-928-D19]|nr:FecR domain-containing protein [Bacteroides sp. OttesenSCG-928-D19]
MNTRLFTLYISYLLGRYSKEEFLEMRSLIANTPRQELEEMLKGAWNRTLPLPEMPSSTRRRVKSNILMAISFADTRKRRAINRWAVAAAILIFLIGGSSLYYLGKHSVEDQSPFIVHIDKGQKAVIKLPDNSDVHLNAETSLEYDLSNRKQRVVQLSGEAYFKVTKNEKRPFIVDMGDVQIWVVGTEFNAKTYSDEDYIQASLVEGSIKLKNKQSSEWQFLKPMEQFVYSKKDGTFRIIPFESEQELGWMDDRLAFSSEPLHKIISRIERWYGVNIDLQCPEIRNDLMSGAFFDEELADVLEAIKIQYKVNYTIKGRNVIISKNQ